MRRTILFSDRAYTVAPNDDPPLAARMSAIVGARVLDELTGDPPQAAITITTDAPGLTPRVTKDGVAGLAGIPAAVFSLLNGLGYHVNIALAADGFIGHFQRVPMNPQPNFPGAFALADLGDIALHREPVFLKGRTMQAGALTPTPLAGVGVSLTGIWRTAPPPNLIVPADPPNIVSLRPRVYFDRAALAASVRQLEMSVVAGDAPALLEDADAKSDVIRVSAQIGFVPGGILAIDADASDLTEFMTIQSIAGASTPDQPASVNLTYPLSNAHRAGAVVRRVTAQPPGADNTLSAAAVPGDACVLLNSMTDLASANVIEIHGGGPPPEYHLLSRFEAVTDASGYYRLPPISRVAQLTVQANDGVHTVTVPATPNYTIAENRIDFMFV